MECRCCWVLTCIQGLPASAAPVVGTAASAAPEVVWPSDWAGGLVGYRVGIASVHFVVGGPGGGRLGSEPGFGLRILGAAGAFRAGVHWTGVLRKIHQFEMGSCNLVPYFLFLFYMII